MLTQAAVAAMLVYTKLGGRQRGVSHRVIAACAAVAVRYAPPWRPAGDKLTLAVWSYWRARLTWLLIHDMLCSVRCLTLLLSKETRAPPSPVLR